MLKRMMLALSVAILTLTVFAQAQETATLVTRSGERITGQLIDMGGAGFTIKVSGADRQVPTNDVTVIEFSGGAMNSADWSKIGEGQQVVWLKNGDIVTGQLFDIGGTSPLRITVKTASGEREFSSNEIGRIVLSKPSNAVATTGSLTPATGAGLVVSAQQAWTPTGITVRKGETLTFNTTGEVQLSTDANDTAAPAGSKSQRFANGAPLPRALAGALIGRIGTNGQPFAVGNQVSIPMPEAGQLFLGVNDDDVNDNRGEFRVEIGQRATGRR